MRRCRDRLWERLLLPTLSGRGTSSSLRVDHPRESTCQITYSPRRYILSARLRPPSTYPREQSCQRCHWGEGGGLGLEYWKILWLGFLSQRPPTPRRIDREVTDPFGAQTSTGEDERSFRSVFSVGSLIGRPSLRPPPRHTLVWSESRSAFPEGVGRSPERFPTPQRSKPGSGWRRLLQSRWEGRRGPRVGISPSRRGGVDDG